MVRLTLLQTANAISDLFGAEAAASFQTDYEIARTTVAFPPLSAPEEGSSFNDDSWRRSDAVAQAVATYVFEHFESVTDCPAPADDDCGKAFVGALAERAFRAPVEEAVRENILTVYDEVRAPEIGASVEEAVKAAVYAVLDSPLFVYRTEFGAAGATEAELPLTPYELASALAFFITNRPPDQELLAAAADDALRTPEELAPHVDRLLESETGRVSLADALFGYLGLPRLNTVALDGAAYPRWNAELAAAMGREAESFLARNLFDAPLGELFTTRRSRVNAPLAELYGLAFPPADAEVAADGFADVDLPEQRAGLVTQAGILTQLARPDGASVIARGAWVNEKLLCGQVAQHPLDDPALAEALLRFVETSAEQTELEKAQYRAEAALCAGCHADFDPYGRLLESFDAIGAYRGAGTAALAGDVTLPGALGSVTLASAAELGGVIAASEAVTSCLARNFLAYALAENTDFRGDGCEVRQIVRGYYAGSAPSFAGLVRQIALAPAFLTRARGDPR